MHSPPPGSGKLAGYGWLKMNGEGVKTRLEPVQLREQLADRTRELAESEARFRDVIERNADAIVVIDRDGIVRFANSMAAKLLGFPVRELVRTPFGFPVVAGETTELDLPRRDAPLVVEMRVVDSEWEGVPAFIATLRDITERKQAEEVARALVAEQAARAAAETAARRFRLLAESSHLLASGLEFDASVSALAKLCVGDLADWAVVYIARDEGVAERVEVAHRDPALNAVAHELGHYIPGIVRDCAIDVLDSRRPLLMESVDERALQSLAPEAKPRELLQALGIGSAMLLPLIARGRCLGALGLATREPRSEGRNDLALAEDLALRSALALDNCLLYQKATEANRAKSDFLAVISHDLRTPLSSIIGYADLLALGLPEKLGDGALERVDRISTSARHLVHLIDELLEFARLDAGHEQVHLAQLPVRMILDEIRVIMEPLAQERGLRIQIRHPDDGLECRTDPAKLRQALLNLVGNAIKYTESGEVTLQARQENEVMVFDVHDTGPGIAPENLKHIFEPFWQLDPGQRMRGSGTGLGLSVVRGVATLLGGEVTVRSVVGDGSTFTLRLPCRPAQPPRG